MNVINEQQLFGPTLKLEQLRHKREALEIQLQQSESEADALQDRFDQAYTRARRNQSFAKNARYFGIGGLVLGAGGLFTGLKTLASSRTTAVVALGVGLVGLAGVAVSLHGDGARDKANYHYGMAGIYAQQSRDRADAVQGQLNQLRRELRTVEGLEAERKAEEAKLRALEVEYVEDALQVGDFYLTFDGP